MLLLLRGSKLRSRVYRPPPSADVDPLYRTSLMEIDRSGKVKMETLETIYLVQSYKKWCTVEDVYQFLESLAAEPFASGRRGVSMRLLRYNRQGLLIRRKIRGRLTQYKLSQKGEDRLIYFWNKFKLLVPPPGWQFMGEEGRVEKELAVHRVALHSEILANQIDRLQKNRPLRTPKVQTVIKFESTLKKIEAAKYKLRIYPRK